MLAASSKRMAAVLDRGTISVDIKSSFVEPENMFGFAQRINPKRSFLFVSKVLGRHIPVRPSVMRHTFDVLARQIPADLEGPVLFVGMAETAVGLGAGVHARYRELTGRDDAVFVCTTRHPLGTPLLCEFHEEHSHATAHSIHRSPDPRVDAMMTGAKSLVLVDDEASTGKTFANLFAALPETLRDGIRTKVLVTLTDWSGGAAAARMGGDVREVSILSGAFRWEPNASAAAAPGVPVITAPGRSSVAPEIACDWGRSGVIDHVPTISAPAAEVGRTLVLGTGEHVWHPYLLAQRLEDEGHDVHYSSVTRSPISIGHSIGSKFEFVDNYGGLVPNYLYNVDPALYAKIVLCTETPAACLSRKLLTCLGPNVEIVESNPGSPK